MNSFFAIRLILILFFLNIVHTFATHNRAGEITYTHVAGFTYEFTITTYTKVSGASADADRPRLGISWGDGTFDSINRTSEVMLLADIKQNKYTARHTYSGPRTYVVGMSDPNRIGDIINISNSVNILFYLEDTVKIYDPNLIGYNNSPQLLNPPIDNGVVGQIFVHNPNAYDPDGDSLDFSIISPLQASGLAVPGYTPPNLIGPGPNNQISINPHTGELIWNTPQVVGIYNIAILVREYRSGVLIGTVIRDLQIFISDANNLPPKITMQEKICVVAGTRIHLNITANDPNAGQIVTLTANGAPFLVPVSPATFVAAAPANPTSAIFDWQTSCDHLTRNDYQVVVKATDNFTPLILSDLKTLIIKILAPAPQNPVAVLNPVNKTVSIKWDSLYACSTNPKFLNFSVWRKKGCNIPIDTCSPDLAALGYQKIGTTNIYTFIDNTIRSGNEYSYRITANFGDRSNAGIIINAFTGIASTEQCIIIPADLPLIYNVDVRSTSTTAGQIYVEWSRPFAQRLDTISNPGPYVFKLYRAEGFSGTNFTLVTTKSFPTFSTINDTSFLDNNLNTQNQPYTYKISFCARATDSLGTSEPASSVYLNAAPQYEAIQLSWNYSVPWINDSFVVYRKNPGASTFDSIATVTITTFRDTGLINDSLSCYVIKSIGAYPVAGLKEPLYNYSEEICARPSDTTKPCTPTLSVNNFCLDTNLDTAEYRNYLTWKYQNTTNCFINDITKVYIYYASNTTDSFKIIDSVLGNTFSNYTHILPNRSLAGCYAVQAQRQNGNLGSLSNTVCVDNCPLYVLPNTFTPNGNGQNELYTPILPYRFVEKIDIKIYNRWGDLVFESTNPYIGWDGKDYKTHKPLNTGVYYYLCEVYYQTVNGIEKLKTPLSGYIHLFR